PTSSSHSSPERCWTRRQASAAISTSSGSSPRSRSLAWSPRCSSSVTPAPLRGGWLERRLGVHPVVLEKALELRRRRFETIVLRALQTPHPRHQLGTLPRERCPDLFHCRHTRPRILARGRHVQSGVHPDEVERPRRKRRAQC